MALLAMMGVFAQSLANIGRVDLGADIDSVVMFSIAARSNQSSGGDAVLVEALEAIPGVSSVASSSRPLLSPGAPRMAISVEGAEAEVSAVSQDFVSSGFFDVFSTEVLAGRVFADDDDFAFGEAIVNRRLAESLGLTPEAAVGRRIRQGASGPGLEIVGVVADVRSFKVTGDIAPQMFLHLPGGPTFYLRGALPAEDLMKAIRDSAARVDPTRPITNLRTMEQQYFKNIATERFAAGASMAFALLATALAALGLYGVLAYSVAQRSREIGMRIALGAPRSHVRGMVLRQVAWMAVIGVLLGAIAASVFGRAARSLLFGVEAGDPLLLTAAAVFLSAIALGAAYVPSRRASSIDPVTVLRYE
jgi:predicted permease